MLERAIPHPHLLKCWVQIVCLSAKYKTSKASWMKTKKADDHFDLFFPYKVFESYRIIIKHNYARI